MNLGTVMGVRAHPDDETYLAAGLFAHAVDLGSRVVDVTATRGEGPARSRSISSSSATSSARASRAILAVTGSMSRVPVLGQRPGHLTPPPDEWGRGVGAHPAAPTPCGDLSLLHVLVAPADFGSKLSTAIGSDASRAMMAAFPTMPSTTMLAGQTTGVKEPLSTPFAVAVEPFAHERSLADEDVRLACLRAVPAGSAITPGQEAS